jgi:hypothetical protein
VARSTARQREVLFISVYRMGRAEDNTTRTALSRERSRMFLAEHPAGEPGLVAVAAIE